MKQTCGVCGKEIETGGFGGWPMKQHYRYKHPSHFFDLPGEQAELTDFDGGNHER